MINNVNSTPSFGSTRIPLKTDSFGEVAKYCRELRKHFGKVQGCNDLEFAKKAPVGEARFVWDTNKNELIFSGENDKLIGKILTDFEPSAKYVDDTTKNLNILG